VENDDETSTREVLYSRVKVFRDKGAQRKNRDDQRAVEKHLEKFLREQRDGRGAYHALLDVMNSVHRD